jgi:ketosteroid isomerase-like protein
MTVDRLRRLEDRLSIRELRYRYCYAIDERDWDALVGLFTEDATLDYGGLGTYEGREGVRAFATDFVAETLTATAHAVHNPLVELDGDGAEGTWYVTSPITYDDGTGGFRWGRYDEAYRRVDGEWLIDDLRMRFVYSLDYDEGWPDFEVFPQE